MKRILLSTLFAFAFTLRAHAGDDRLGVQTHYGHPGWEPLSTLDAARELGVGWIRDDLFWAHVETEKGKYAIPDFAWAWLKAAKERGLKVIVILNGANELYADPYDAEGYADFARFAARELRGHVHAFELINEPFGHFRKAAGKTLQARADANGWDPKARAVQSWVHKYIDTMNRMAEAIHETAPGEYKIIGLGCFPALNKMMLAEKLSPRIDGLAAHPYSYYLPPEYLPYGDTPEDRQRDGVGVGDARGTFTAINADLLATAKANKGPTELWLTEQGYTTFQPAGPGGNTYAGYTEEAQAVYAQRRLMECLGTGVRMAVWYNLREKGVRPHNAEDHFGLLRRDGAPKPAYTAIQKLTRAMAHREPEAWGSIELRFAPDRPAMLPDTTPDAPADPADYRAYPFVDRRNGERVLALWSTERAGGDHQPRTATLRVATKDAPSGVTVMDLMSGQEKAVDFEKTDDALVLKKLALPAHPILLVFGGAATAERNGK